ncbi:hypothetical protein DE146DRAFT_760266 [Phaeosphaeria sp. MPI-PUGE-AT-0046c]|nr:hypothetical protein DE146DRAFT_760266 [Phaeosphaeria sp. MPI-PUGE-AT-0046c]
MKSVAGKYDNNRPDNDQNQAAELDDLVNILTGRIGQTCLPHSAKVEFWDAQIIAERRYTEGTKKTREIDFLVEALPVWRRHGSEHGVDVHHLTAWQKLKADDSNVVRAGDGSFHITMHRTHPLFEQWAVGKDMFVANFQPASKDLVRQDNDQRDRNQAMLMLGHLLHRCLNARVEDQRALNDLTVAVILGEDDAPTASTLSLDEITYGRRFLQLYNLKQRKELAETLLADEAALGFGSWTIALCIAILPSAEILAQWREDAVPSERTHAMRNRLKEYRGAITTFLDVYHEETQGSEPFLYTLHTFHTLAQMLKQEVLDVVDDVDTMDGVQDEIGDIEDDDEVMGSDPAREAIDEFSDGEEQRSNVAHSSEDGQDDNLKSDTEESHNLQAQETAKKHAVLSKPGKRATRGKKRRSEEEANVSGDAGHRRTRQRKGGVRMTQH